MDAQNPNFSSSSFDQILAIGVIEHLKKPLFALKNWTKLLKKGGILILSTPNKNLNFFQRFLGKNPYHIREFGYFELKKILQKDYQVIATEKSFLASVEIPFFHPISFLWETFFPPFLSPESIFICKKK
jgi:SAM-dependent methyltransferase